MSTFQATSQPIWKSPGQAAKDNLAADPRALQIAGAIAPSGSPKVGVASPPVPGPALTFGRSTSPKWSFGAPKKNTSSATKLSEGPSTTLSAQSQQAWETTIESLDFQETELHQTQMKLMREQMSNFIRDFSALHKQVEEMRLQREAEAMQVASVHEELHRDRQEMHAELMARIDTLQVDYAWHSSRLDNVASVHEELHRDRQEMQAEFMARIETLHADSAGHSSRLDEVVAILGDGLFEDRLSKSLLVLEQRVAELHEAHGESSQHHGEAVASLKDAHSNHLATFSGHAQLAETVHAKMLDRTAKMADSVEQHNGKIDHLVKRMASCEAGRASLSAMFDDRHASLLDRVEYIDSKMGDSAEQHARALEDLRAARREHTAALSKSTKCLDDHKEATEGRQATFQERLDELEQVLGVHSEKHGEGLAAASSKLERVNSRLSTLELLPGTLEELRRSHDGLVSENEVLAGHHTTMQGRVDKMDKSFGEQFDKHSKATEGRHGALQERLDEVEQVLGVHAEKHGEGLAAASSKLDRVDSRLSVLELLPGTLEELRRSHDVVLSENGVLAGHHTAMQGRVDKMDKSFGEQFDKHSKHLQELLHANVTHKGAISKHFKNVDAFRAEREAHHEALVTRLDSVEQSHGERHAQHTSAAEELHAKCESILAGVENHEQQVIDLQQSHDILGAKKAELHEQMIELQQSHDSLGAKKTALQAGHALLDDRVEFLEKRFGEIHAAIAEKHSQAASQ